MSDLAGWRNLEMNCLIFEFLAAMRYCCLWFPGISFRPAISLVYTIHADGLSWHHFLCRDRSIENVTGLQLSNGQLEDDCPLETNDAQATRDKAERGPVHECISGRKRYYQ